MLKLAAALVLSAALFWLAPNTQSKLNNLEPKAAVTKPAGQVRPSQTAPAQEVKPVEQPAPAPIQETPPVQQLSPHEELMQQAGIPQEEWQATDYIVSHESSWNHLAVNRSSGATGLCQALPASKMASAGGDYLTNPVTQLKWCHEYSAQRYGGWWSSFAFWKANRWW